MALSNVVTFKLLLRSLAAPVCSHPPLGLAPFRNLHIQVALSNVFTCKLLLRSAVSTGTSDYEGLAAAVGGPWLKVGLSSLVLIRGAPPPAQYCSHLGCELVCR